ncbi:MAG: YdcF family protein [Actinomycetota bacterium]|nr:YdcF family protein [Actinomycetota bacterium]
MKRVRTKELLRDLWMLWRVYRGGSLALAGEAAPRTAVIMGAQVLRGGRPSPALEARTRHAARLYAEGKLDLLVPTGGLGEHPPREAVLMRDILWREGVPDGAVLLEDEAVNTWDSAVRLAEISRKQQIGGVRVVTDPLHCVRTVWAFREVGLEAWVEPAYDNPMWRKPWSRWGQLIREAVALVWYRVRYRVGSRPLP